MTADGPMQAQPTLAYFSAMWDSHADMVRRACRAWCEGDISIYREMYAPDVVAEGGGLWPEGEGSIRGAESVIRNFDSIMKAFASSELHPLRFFGEDDRLAVELLWRGLLAGSDTAVEQRVACAYRFRDGLITYTAWYAQLGEALDALGLDATLG
jgi:ketosteroid isomerase-like protein